MDKPPGSRSKHGNQPTAWNIIYDPNTDKILTWTNKRIQIYRRRGRRQFVYSKRKYENTFPRTAQPIRGHWQGSYFIVEHIDHWTNTPTALPDNHSTTQRQDTRTMEETDITRHNQRAHSDKHTHSNKPTGNIQRIMASTHCKWKTAIATNTMATKHMANPHGTQHRQSTRRTWQLRNKQKATPKLETSQDSHMSSKWHPLACIKIQWNKRHLDAYLALTEVICEWNTEPG